MKRYYVTVGFGKVAVIDRTKATTMTSTFRRDTPGVVRYWKATQDDPKNRVSKWGTRERAAAGVVANDLNAKDDDENGRT